MEEYLGYYGWHFSKKMAEWAASKMYKKDATGNKKYIDTYTKESLEPLLKRMGIKMEVNYDAVYIANMCKADFLGTAVPDENCLALYVKGVIEDPDGYEGLPFTRFYADCIGSGCPIPWEDVI